MPEPSQIADKTSPPKKRRSWLRFSLKSLMLLLTLVCVVLGGKLQYDWYKKKWLVQKWIAPIVEDARQSKDGITRYVSYGPFNAPKGWKNLPPSPEEVASEDEVELLKFGILELDSPIERFSALYLLVESRKEVSLPALWSLLPKSRHTDMQALLLHLVSLPQNPDDIARLQPYLQSSSAEVRSAAAEAIGIIHEPSYSIEYTNTVPSIRSSFLALYVESEAEERERLARIPAGARNPIEDLMLHGATSEERTAAARALVSWSPEAYSLRLAEWGVWINDQGNLGLATSVLAENPPFVHRTGNPTGSLTLNRTARPFVISKPIVHLTADCPLAVDLEIAIAHGRPWYAYPKPDGFTVHYGSSLDAVPQMTAAELEKLEPQNLLSLAEGSEGYPWVHPHDWSWDAYFKGSRPPTVAERMKSIPVDKEVFGVRRAGGIEGIGLRWQNLIVSPAREPWMKLADVPDSTKYKWWSALREVPSSWVQGNGETERFLYYDGPTLANSPVTAQLKDDALLLRSQPMFHGDVTSQLKDEALLQRMFYGEWKDNDLYSHYKLARNRPKRPWRDCLFIEVSQGQPSAFRFRMLAMNGLEEKYELADQTRLKGNAVEEALHAILLRRGLTREEAAGLIASWREKFFQNPGRRLLTFLTPAEYDRMCPLEIRPATTEHVRVGIVLTEF